jgi:asparagine synthase (glutamine-hydrolysing)
VLRESLAGRDPGDVIAKAWQSAPVDADLDRMIWADLMTRLPEHTLALSDRLGMAHGLEVRCPLLDVGFANFCLGMPAGLRVRGRVTKYALRRAVRDWMPADHARRPKQGFMLPVAHWLDGDEMRRVHAQLTGGRLAQEGWIERNEVERILREHAHRRSDNHVRIWMLLGLEAWHRMYLDGGIAIGETVTTALADVGV